VERGRHRRGRRRPARRAADATLRGEVIPQRVTGAYAAGPSIRGLLLAIALLLGLVALAPAANARGVAGSASAPAAEARSAKSIAWIDGVVEHVYDGDSFRLHTGDGRDLGVRIAGIDAPERTQPFANVSRQALREAIDDREVRVAAMKVDPYGRVVGRVFVAGRDVGLEQLDRGLAWHFVRYDADLAPAERERYAQAQRKAQTRRAGLWKQNDPQAPWLFREQRR